VVEVASLRPGTKIEILGAVSGYFERWRETVETSAETLGIFADGGSAVVANGNFFYLAGWPGAATLAALMRLVCRKAGLSTIELPAEVRLRRRGNLTFAFNYAETSWTAPFGGEPLIGEASVAPRSFSVWRSSPADRDQ
jgi:beta-galactosidase